MIALHFLDAGPLSQTDMARLAKVETQTMSRTVERLERAGFIERRADDNDRRRMLVTRPRAGDRADTRCQHAIRPKGGWKVKGPAVDRGREPQRSPPGRPRPSLGTDQARPDPASSARPPPRPATAATAEMAVETAHAFARRPARDPVAHRAGEPLDADNG